MNAKLIGVDTLAKLDLKSARSKYDAAGNFFNQKPMLFATGASTAPAKESYASDEGIVQFHLIGQSTTDPKFSDIMNENQDNLLAMGGLVHDYMHTHYPKVDTQKLDINTWSNVISNIPDISIGKAVQKNYSNSLIGTSVSGEFLSMIASAIITDGASLLADFKSFLSSVGDVVFSVHNTSESYKALTCTYQSYLVDNGAGGYFDYGAIVLRQIEFAEHFMELKTSCSDTKRIKVDMNYTEIVNLVQTRRIRKGGQDYDLFQKLVNANSTEQFKKADNFFNGGSTPQKDISPKV